MMSTYLLHFLPPPLCQQNICTDAPAYMVHGCKVFSDVKSFFRWSQSVRASTRLQPAHKVSLLIYSQFSLDKTLTLQASASVLFFHTFWQAFDTPPFSVRTTYMEAPSGFWHVSVRVETLTRTSRRRPAAGGLGISGRW